MLLMSSVTWIWHFAYVLSVGSRNKYEHSSWCPLWEKPLFLLNITYILEHLLHRCHVSVNIPWLINRATIITRSYIYLAGLCLSYEDNRVMNGYVNWLSPPLNRRISELVWWHVVSEKTYRLSIMKFKLRFEIIIKKMRCTKGMLLSIDPEPLNKLFMLQT